MRFEEYRKHDAISLAGLIAKRQVSADEVLETAIARPNRSILRSMPSCTSSMSRPARRSRQGFPKGR